MNYTQACDSFADIAAQKTSTALRQPLAFLIGSLLGGAFTAMALILALSCSAGLPVGVRPLVSGSMFGLGVALAMFAGGELFTGHVMVMAFGRLQGRITSGAALYVLAFVWLGNLIGACTIAALFAYGGGGVVFSAPPAFMLDLVAHRQSAAPMALVCRGALCNFLICLGLWAAARVRDDVAKIWLAAWCLLAFVASGFENSVANMAAFAIGLMDPARAGSLVGAFYNLEFVTLGNILGGGVMVAGAYMLSRPFDQQQPADHPARAVQGAEAHYGEGAFPSPASLL